MVTKVEPPWHETARELRAQGFGVVAISRALARSEASVRHALDERGYRQRQREQSVRYRAARKDGAVIRTKPREPLHSFIKPHLTRTPRVLLVAPAERRQIFRAYLDGRISRHEMLRRISAEA